MQFMGKSGRFLGPRQRTGRQLWTILRNRTAYGGRRGFAPGWQNRALRAQRARRFIRQVRNARAIALQRIRSNIVKREIFGRRRMY